MIEGAIEKRGATIQRTRGCKLTRAFFLFSLFLSPFSFARNGRNSLLGEKAKDGFRDRTRKTRFGGGKKRVDKLAGGRSVLARVIGRSSSGDLSLADTWRQSSSNGVNDALRAVVSPFVSFFFFFVFFLFFFFFFVFFFGRNRQMVTPSSRDE